MSSTQTPQAPYGTNGEWRPPTDGTGGPVPTPAPAPARKGRAKLAAGIAAALIAVGGATGFVVTHTGSSSTTAASAQGPGGTAGAAGGAGNLGFTPTDYRLSGTITALGSDTVTIQTSDGTTTTYSVTANTHLAADGATSDLSAFAVGDAVNASTTTDGGTELNDMVSGMGGAVGGAAPDGTAPDGTATGGGTA